MCIRDRQNVITHFGSIYAKKRSLVADRKAVENFERQKGEPLEICLQRYDLIVDKIRHLHSDAAWGEVRQGLKRAKLMQIIADDTRAYIQNEEDDAIESTGMPYDFEKLVKMASRYERQHNKLPDENIQTIFDTSSQSSIPRGKKKQREFIEQVVQEVLQVNPLAARATSAERIREASRANRDDSRSSQRQSRFDQNRSLSQDEFFTLSSPNSQNSQNRADAPPAQTALSTLDHNDHIRPRVDLDHLHLGLDSRSQTTGEITHLDPGLETQTRKIDFPHSSRKLSQA